MDIDNFKSYLNNPSKLISEPDPLLIKEVIKKYPFFNTAHLFLAIAQNQKDSIFIGNRLNHLAIYLGERSTLFGYIKGHEKIGKEKYNELVFYPTEVKFGQEKKQNREEEVPDIPIKKDKPVKQPSKNQNWSLIDKFIETKPSIQRPKAAFYSPTEMASRSLEDDDDFATEILAKIHIKNNNYEKAIKIYQKLSLQNPEKSDYFAHLIKTLTDQINE